MRYVLMLALIACGPPTATPPASVPAPVARAPRLAPPPPLDPDARGAAYLTSVALQLQPGWAQFLDDCRMRLPVTHPLNTMALAATADLVVDPRGHVVAVELSPGSGNADFDRAVRDAIGDVAPFLPPPRSLWSDDDRLHLRWLFARDRRQAGPATATIVDVELPLGGVVERLIREGDLARAAQRITRAAPTPVREQAIERLMIATLREALGSSDGAVRRGAVESIGHAGVAELAPTVRELLATTNDIELRLVAISAIAELRDARAIDVLLAQLKADVREQPRLARAQTAALVTLGQRDAAAKLLRSELVGARIPNPVALDALALAPAPELGAQLVAWSARPDARTRVAVCEALAGYPEPVGTKAIARGLRDRDATVRATCVAAARATRATAKPTLERLHKLARDRDRGVRAAALLAVATLDGEHLRSAADDAAAEVRAAYAQALGVVTPAPATALTDLRALVDDRDPDVRAAAWQTLVRLRPLPAELAGRVTRAVADPAPQVRRAVIPLIDDDDVLLDKLGTRDDAPEVRTAALVQLGARRGRNAIANAFLDRLAAGAPGSADRVRVAYAWLLAR